MKIIKYSIFLSIILLLTSLSCAADAVKQPQLITGKQLYEYHCSACHQLDGKGNSEKGYPPISHTTLKSWQIRHKINGDETQDGQMPALTNISKSKAKLISDYIKTLK